MPKCFWHTFFCRLAVKKGCLDQESTLYQVVKFKFYACKQNCPISILNKMIPFAASVYPRLSAACLPLTTYGAPSLVGFSQKYCAKVYVFKNLCEILFASPCLFLCIQITFTQQQQRY